VNAAALAAADICLAGGYLRGVTCNTGDTATEPSVAVATATREIFSPLR
jgi:hypothetical protein